MKMLESWKKNTAILIVVSTMHGCATGLNSVQEQEYAAFEEKNVLVQEKDPTTGAWLGVLPGGGSFYAREPVYGVLNLLMWPLSITWDTFGGYAGSKSINYDMTKNKLDRQKSIELKELEDQLSLNKIDKKMYISERKKINKKYDYIED